MEEYSVLNNLEDERTFDENFLQGSHNDSFKQINNPLEISEAQEKTVNTSDWEDDKKGKEVMCDKDGLDLVQELFDA